MNDDKSPLSRIAIKRPRVRSVLAVAVTLLLVTSAAGSFVGASTASTASTATTTWDYEITSGFEDGTFGNWSTWENNDAHTNITSANTISGNYSAEIVDNNSNGGGQAQIYLDDDFETFNVTYDFYGDHTSTDLKHIHQVRFWGDPSSGYELTYGDRGSTSDPSLDFQDPNGNTIASKNVKYPEKTNLTFNHRMYSNGTYEFTSEYTDNGTILHTLSGTVSSIKSGDISLGGGGGGDFTGDFMMDNINVKADTVGVSTTNAEGKMNTDGSEINETDIFGTTDNTVTDRYDIINDTSNRTAIIEAADQTAGSGWTAAGAADIYHENDTYYAVVRQRTNNGSRGWAYELWSAPADSVMDSDAWAREWREDMRDNNLESVEGAALVKDNGSYHLYFSTDSDTTGRDWDILHTKSDTLSGLETNLDDTSTWNDISSGWGSTEYHKDPTIMQYGSDYYMVLTYDYTSSGARNHQIWKSGSASFSTATKTATINEGQSNTGTVYYDDNRDEFVYWTTTSGNNNITWKYYNSSDLTSWNHLDTLDSPDHVNDASGNARYQTYAAAGDGDGIVAMEYDPNDDGVSETYLWDYRNTTGGTQVSGEVRTQDGTPVSNATVKILGVDYDQLDLTDPNELDERANELIQKAGDVKPSTWDSTLDVSDNIARQLDGRYVAVHDREEWGLTGYTDTPSLSNPTIRVDPGEETILSVWDASSNPTIQDGVDKHLPGTTVQDSKIVIEELGPGGDVVSTKTISTTNTYQVGSPLGGNHDYATQYFQQGFYNVYPKGNPSAEYTIVAGSPSDIFQGYAKDLENQAGSLEDRAQWIRDRLNEGKFQSTTVVTDENGNWNASVGSQVKTVAVTAHKGPLDKLQQDPANVSLEDIRTLYQTTDVNQSVYLPSQPTRASPPESNVTVRVTEASAPGYVGLDRYDNITAALRDLLGNLSYSDLPGFMQNRLSNMTNEELENVYGELDALREQNSDLEERVEELLGEQVGDEDPGDLSNEELRERVQAMQQAMNELRESIDSGDPDSEVGEDSVSVSFPFDTTLDPSQVMVMAHMSSGETRTLSTDSEYVSIDSNTLGGSTVHIEDYPLSSSDANLANFEVRVANNEGVGRSSESIRNPNYDGDIPGLDALSFNTLQPGPQDPVQMTIQPDTDTPFRNMTSAKVYAPDGTALPTTISDGRTVKFSTAGAGAHTIEAKFATTDGETWTVTQRLRAGDADRNLPPGIRLSETPYGTVAVTGDGFSGGSVDVASGGQSVTVTGKLPVDTEVPSKPVHVYTTGADLAPDSDITVRVVRGEDETSIQQHKRVIMHLPAMTDSGSSGLLSVLGSGQNTYWRNGQALPVGESDQGVVRQSNGSLVIETYTDEQGEVSISTNNNADALEYWQYQVDLWTQQLPNPGNMVPDVGVSLPGLGLLGMPVPALGLLAAHRRRRRTD
jgi:hypothetical protein